MNEQKFIEEMVLIMNERKLTILQTNISKMT